MKLPDWFVRISGIGWLVTHALKKAWGNVFALTDMVIRVDEFVLNECDARYN